MPKVDIKRLDSVTNNDTTATKQINDNFQALQQAVENTISRDGTVPNYMDANFDLNSYRIINAGDPVGDQDVVTLKYFEEKAGGAIEAAAEAKASASKAASSAQSALVASNNAIGQLAQAEGLLTATEQFVDSAKADINTAVSDAESTISTIVSDAEGSITNIAVTEANKAIANAAQEATDTATANVNSYVDGTVKPSLQTYVDQAQENANSAATSMEQAALSATAASNYASNASADADNAANSAGSAANSATAAATSETNAKASETNAAATKAEVEAIAKLASFGNVGDIKYTSRTDVPNGGAWCDGTLYTKAQFPDVYQMLVNGKLQSTTVSDFDSKVSANGSCGFFGLDTANERFKVPMLKNVYLKAGQAPSMFGTESLPNITGSVRVWIAGDSSGAFTGTNDGLVGRAGGEVRDTGIATFNASRSSSTYQDGAKVNPDHVTYRAYVVLYNAKDVSSDMSTEYQLNNPFSLLDYKWSEYELSNASWLLSNGQFNSGATYPDVYELLLKIHNGTETKDGVSVKLSTEAYTDIDFVINTADTTFRLPIKVKLASGNRVAGNGMTVGLTNGTANGGLSYVPSAYMGTYTDTYGQEVSNSTVTTTAVLGRLGITTDPTKSGIETSSSGLKLYFYVGETVQDANVIAASQVLTKVANGIDRTVATDRETVVGWGMPDYSAGVSFASGQSFAQNGWLFIDASAVVNGTSTVSLGGVLVYKKFDTDYQNGYHTVSDTSWIPYPKNLVITSSGSFTSLIFYPAKGTN